MHFNSMLISSFLLVPVVLAGSNEPRFDSDISPPVGYKGIYSGSIISQAAGTFYNITSTLTLPYVSGPTDSTASMAIGIDGYSCVNFLQTGVIVTVTTDGTHYQAYYEWSFDGREDLNIPIGAGDEIQLTLAVLNSTSATVTVENLRNSQSVTRQISSIYQLCQQDATWLVEKLVEDDNTPSLTDFGTVSFNNAVAVSTGDQTYGPQNGTIRRVNGENGQMLIDVTTEDFAVTVHYE